MTTSLGRRAGFLLTALVLLAASCGGSDGTSELASAPSTADAATTASTSSDTASEGTSADTDEDADAGGRTADDGAPNVAETCEPFPSFSEGSFYVEANDGSELTRGLATPDAIPLTIRISVLDAETCAGLADRSVELWGAAPDGRYSGVSTQPDGMAEATLDDSWLRGRSRTDADGAVEFATVLPGWIPGQAPHVHVSIPVDETRSFTARLLIPDDVTGEAYATGAYAARGEADVTVAMEVERDPGAGRTVIALSPNGDGYVASVVLAIADAELRGRPLSAVQTTEAPEDGADAVLVDAVTRNFDQIGGELQEMFNRAGVDLGVDPEVLYSEFRFVTSEDPPDLAAIAERLGVTQDALALALPLLAGGAPTPGG